MHHGLEGCTAGEAPCFTQGNSCSTQQHPRVSSAPSKFFFVDRGALPARCVARRFSVDFPTLTIRLCSPCLSFIPREKAHDIPPETILCSESPLFRVSITLSYYKPSSVPGQVATHELQLVIQRVHAHKTSTRCGVSNKKHSTAPLTPK